MTKLPTLLVALLLAALLAWNSQAEDENPADEKPAAEEKQADEAKPDEEKKADEEKPAEEKPAEEKPAEEKPAEEKKEDEKKPEEKPAEEKKPEEKPAEAKKIQVDVNEAIVSGLDNPAGIAIQPDSGLLFVSNSGAGKIISVNPASASEVKDVVTGFKTDVYGKGPMYNIGPLGLGFIAKNMLVVGGGDLLDGEELVRVYELPAEGAVGVDDAKHKLGPIGPGDSSAKGEGNFYGVAISSDAIYISSNGDDTKGWVLRSKVEGGTPGALEPYIATKEQVQVDAPVGITMHPKKPYLVVGQMGEINKPGDSLLTFYRATDGKLLMNLETGLYDIAALAYSPRGRLYALDFGWMDEKEGGLYRLDATLENGQQGVKAVKVVSLDKPTAMAFAPDGTLYVTVIGTPKEGSDEKPGQLIKIKGEL